MLQRKTETGASFLGQAFKDMPECPRSSNLFALHFNIIFCRMLVQFVFCWFFLTDGEFPNTLVVAHCEVLKA
jgi:hypothetical protein